MGERRITIAGAGPSGLAAAIALAKAGRDVTLFERAATVGSKFIDGFQILENYTRQENVLGELRGIGIEPDFVLMPGHEVTYYNARLRPYRAKSAEPFGYYVRRGPGPGTLDTCLLEQAVAAGVELLFERAVTPEEVDIVATGPKGVSGIARELVFQTDLPDSFRVLLDKSLTRDGFAYLFVINGQATLGLAILSEYDSLGEKAERTMERFLELGHFEVRDPVMKSSFVDFSLRADRSADGPLRVGEAAGFQDFLFGLGIRRSIRSGGLAAASITQGLDYRAVTRSNITTLMNISILNRLFFETAGRVGFGPFLALTGRFDFRKLGLFLTQPGPVRRLTAAALKVAWKNRSGCKHGPDCVWCRKGASRR